MPPAARTGSETLRDHLGHQAQGRGLLTAVVPAGLESLGHHRIDPGGLGLAGEARAGDHVDHRAPRGFEAGGVGGRVAGRGEDHGHIGGQDDRDLGGDIGVEQRQIHPEGLVGGLPALAEVLGQGLGVH